MADTSAAVYERLGVRACINASGHVTRLGGSLMPAAVLDAMAEAGRHFVPLEELHEAAGRRIAQLTGAEAALVTTGACGGIVLGAAACIAGTDPERIHRLPDVGDGPCEIVVPPTPGRTWVHYTRMVGGVVVEVESLDDLQRAAAAPQAAMLLYLPSVHDTGPLSLAQVLEVAAATGVPLMVDAADKLPPRDSLRRYHELGVDLVTVSGGKGLRGPQCTGLLMGRADLIEAAYRNSCPPGVGRPMKVGKEEIVGVVTAAELYLSRDHDADEQRWAAQLQHIQTELAGLDGVRTEIFAERSIAEGDRLRVYPPPGVGAGDGRAALAEGTPRVMVGRDGEALVIDPQTLQPGEEVPVAERLRAVLISA